MQTWCDRRVDISGMETKGFGVRNHVLNSLQWRLVLGGRGGRWAGEEISICTLASGPVSGPACSDL